MSSGCLRGEVAGSGVVKMVCVLVLVLVLVVWCGHVIAVVEDG